MEVTAQMVKELREMTGAGIMNCKKALVETDGDFDKAVEVLREKGLATAAKKSGRIAAEGLIAAYISEDGKQGALVEVNCETDFVAKNEEFKVFAKRVAKQVIVKGVKTVDELVETTMEDYEGKNVKTVLTELIAKIGENMSVRRFETFICENGVLESYIHGERIGVMVQLACDKASDDLKVIAKELALQIAAMNPICISSAELPADKLETEKQIYRTQALEEGKPEAIVEKMVQGRVKKYYKEVCLIDQAWVKDGDKSIGAYLKEESTKLGAEISVSRFVRFEKGEGIEKQQMDFAEEVRQQMGK